MVTHITFDARFSNEDGVGLDVDADIYVELFEDGESTPKETRTLGTDPTTAIIKTADVQGTIYTTSVDGGKFSIGDVTAKWYAKLSGARTNPYPFQESIANVEDDVLNTTEIKRYIRTMLGAPVVAVELTGDHYSTIVEDTLSTYNKWVPIEKVAMVDLVLGQNRYPMPSLPRGGPFHVSFVRKEGIPLISDPLFGREYPRGCFIESTKVPLLDGSIKTMGELVKENKEDFWVYSYDVKRKKIVPGLAKRAKKTVTKAPMLKVVLDDGTDFTCTPDHRILLKSGSYCEAQDLVVGDSIRSLYSRYSRADQGDALNGYEIVSDGDRTDYTHRMVALGYLGHYRKDGFDIHHKNFNKEDNAPNNLEFLERSDHLKLHAEQAAINNSTPEARERSRRLMTALWENDRERMLANSRRAIKKARNAIDPDNQKEAGRANIIKYNGSDKHIEDVKKCASEGRHKGKDNLIAYNKSEEKKSKLRENARRLGRSKINIHKRFHGGSPVWDCKKCWPDGMPEDLLEFAKARRKNHKVVSVEVVENQDGYDIEVPQWKNFAIATEGRSGVFVHNSQLDFDQYTLGISFWQTLRKVTSQEPIWWWEEETRDLWINIGGSNLAGPSGNYFVTVRYFANRTVDKIRQDHFKWFKRFCLVQAKKIISEIRGKYMGQIPAPGGRFSMNATLLIESAEREELELLEELRNMAPTVPPLRG